MYACKMSEILAPAEINTRIRLEIHLEREVKEIELWEDYLIYSVMLGQNQKVIEEYEKYIEIEEDKC